MYFRAISLLTVLKCIFIDQLKGVLLYVGLIQAPSSGACHKVLGKRYYRKTTTNYEFRWKKLHLQGEVTSFMFSGSNKTFTWYSLVFPSVCSNRLYFFLTCTSKFVWIWQYHYIIVLQLLLFYIFALGSYRAALLDLPALQLHNHIIALFVSSFTSDTESKNASAGSMAQSFSPPPPEQCRSSSKLQTSLSL